MSDLTEVKDRVKSAISIVDHIRASGLQLAGGPDEWKAKCPFHSESDASFSVTASKGFFHCFGCQANGDIFEWEMRRKGVDFMTALRTLANSVGIALHEPRIYQPAEAKAAAAPKRGYLDASKYSALVPDGKVWKYLTEKRKLDAGKCVEYSVGQTIDGEAYVFAYKHPKDSRTEFLKVVKVDRVDGKKEEWRDPKGGRSILFGMHAVPAGATELVISEGEIDAITWSQYGVAAVSVPSGAAALNWVDGCWDWLQQFKKIHVSFDEDTAGRKRVVELVKRLGIARTDIVRLPEKAPGVRYKDANECLQAGVTADQMRSSLENTEEIRPATLKSIYDFEQEIWNQFHPEGIEQIGLRLPWGNRNGSSLPFRFRYGEVTVWTGYNKHGKSEVLNHCIIDLCFAQGDKALVCSLEIQAPTTYKKLIRMAMARRDVCAKEDREHFRERCLKPMANKIWVYDHVGSAAIDDVLNAMLYAYQRYGCRQFVLDSLMRFEGLDGEGQDKWERQKAFMEQVVAFAQMYGVHVHLVAHSKKPDKGGEQKIPKRYDISGSADITNLCSSVIVVWRNRKKQDMLEELFQVIEEIWASEYPDAPMPTWKRLLGGPPPKEAPEAIRQSYRTMIDFIEEKCPGDMRDKFINDEGAPAHDAYLLVDAQRGGDGDTPSRHLWFHYDSLQFIEASPLNTKLSKNDPRKRPVVYVNQPLETDEEI